MLLVRLIRGAGASVALAALLLLGGGASAALAWSPPAPIANAVVKTTNVPIQMSDGTTLYADIVQPADSSGNALPGRFPVLLTQTPYNKNTPSLNFEDDYLVEHGYIQVIADVRGTGSSEGAWNSFGPREQQDGYDLAEWARVQPWSDGSIGLHGTSYGAINQFLTAELQPPGVKAAFPIVPMSDAYRDVTFAGGEVNTSFIPTWLGLVTATGLLPPTYSASDPTEAANVLVQHSGGALSFQASQILDSTTGGNAAYDGPFYQVRSPIDMISRDRIPTFVVGGWFDLFQRGEPLLYQALRRQHVPTRLLMGPWYHITAGNGLPAQGVPTLDDLELRWMNHYVKGLPDPGLDNAKGATDTIPPVTYYENGSNKWTSADGWYAPDAGFQALHLSGPAAPQSPGTLSPTGPPKSQSPDTLVFNPATGVCSRSTIQWTAGAGGGDGTPCETDSRANDATSLSYDIPIAHDMHVLGPMNARVWVGSTGGRDSLITARVEDVAPDGTATQMSAGWATISLRALDQSKTVFADGLMTQPYHPYTQASVLPIPSDGSPVEVDVEIYPTGWDLLAGHTLRLTLQEADVPHLMAPLPTELNSAGATLSIYHDAAHDSELVIPERGAAIAPGLRPAVKRASPKRATRHRARRNATRRGRRKAARRR
ncbi:MAG TPA: CocE/NonD family hydrolase [Solirubrobacteraceae bacterium]|nr:CocE/NonD family hydrolase [Solirubrobacteraceae bacterium]